MQKSSLRLVLAAMFFIGLPSAALAIEGDITGNGQVGFDDLADISLQWLSNCSADSWCDDTDIDHSGKVDVVDFGLLADNWLKSDFMSLAGQWRFKLDPYGIGQGQGWYTANLSGTDTIALPGTTDEGGYGTQTFGTELGRLNRLWKYEGAAWYQTDITISDNWDNKRVSLFLERCHWQTKVWLDNNYIGMQDSLCIPHIYDISDTLSVGTHRLTVCVDNTYKYDIGAWAHTISEESQTNWNGIVGRIELQARDKVNIGSVRVFPDTANKEADLEIDLNNHTGQAVDVSLIIRAKTVDDEQVEIVGSGQVEFNMVGSQQVVNYTLQLDENIELWDEFTTALYEIDIELTADDSVNEFSDGFSEQVGIREVAVENKLLKMNGRTIFLRGEVDSAVFPLTGYPSMTVLEWLDIFNTAKSYGLNHLRCHSWCPPQAAFVAADRIGFMLQVETPLWVQNIGQSPSRDQFISDELNRILDTYGNHPSFTMMCMGNELGGEESFLNSLVQQGKSRDSRHLYTGTTHFLSTASDDYRIGASAAGGLVRGQLKPSTDWDYNSSLVGEAGPVISHEIGQHVIYPSYDEISKYTGVFEARNLEVFRDSLIANGMGDLAQSFNQASGRFVQLLYKADIEAALRTDGFGGFELLGIRDYPGHGEALIGVLDSFWDSKGIISPEGFQRFCSATVPLVRMDKRVWTNNESFNANIEISHFGSEQLDNTTWHWSIKSDIGTELASGNLGPFSIPTGDITSIGSINTSLASVTFATKYILTVSLNGVPSVGNDWELWVYPQTIDTSVPPEIYLAEAFDEAAKAALAAGDKVLLLWPSALPATNGVMARFEPVFWSIPLFPNQPSTTLGIFCDPCHPAMGLFPTESHTNWQWWELIQPASAFNLDSTEASYRPIVHFIEDFHQNSKLGSIFEATVGPGKLLVCGFDLLSDLANRPAARQLRHSLIEYMQSVQFAPGTAMSETLLDGILEAMPVLEDTPPPNPQDARLHVDAAANAPIGSSSWSKSTDDIIVLDSGFDYSVTCTGSWKDAIGSAWYGGQVTVYVQCPTDFTGTLYVHFDDLGDQGRRADVTYEGQGTWHLGSHNHTEGGLWAAFEVTATEAANGWLTLVADCKAGPNITIAGILLGTTEVLENTPPPDPENAQLHVDAAAYSPLNVSVPWVKSNDNIIASDIGFDYSVTCTGSWRDANASAWHGGQVTVDMQCPTNFTGTLYGHFYDFGDQDRRGSIVFESQPARLLEDHTGDGLWGAFEVTSAEASDGSLVLTADLTAGPNITITEILLIPD